VAPSILMMVTSFTRIVVVLSLLRSALGLQQSPPNAVLIGLSLFLTAYIMAPTLEASWRDGIQPLMNNEITQEQGFERASEPIRAFMESHVREKDLQLFIDLAGKPAEAPAGAAIAAPDTSADAKAEATPLRALIPAFMLSELRRAFEIGFLLFLPFLIIDMVIAAILTSMGMMMLPPLVVFAAVQADLLRAGRRLVAGVRQPRAQLWRLRAESMDTLELVRAVLALVLVLGLIGGATWAARRFGPAMWFGARAKATRSLGVIESLPLDARHRLVLRAPRRAKSPAADRPQP
jgi:flagellar biosynthetic protein FliP